MTDHTRGIPREKRRRGRPRGFKPAEACGAVKSRTIRRSDGLPGFVVWTCNRVSHSPCRRRLAAPVVGVLRHRLRGRLVVYVTRATGNARRLHKRAAERGAQRLTIWRSGGRVTILSTKPLDGAGVRSARLSRTAGLALAGRLLRASRERIRWSGAWRPDRADPDDAELFREPTHYQPGASSHTTVHDEAWRRAAAVAEQVWHVRPPPDDLPPACIPPGAWASLLAAEYARIQGVDFSAENTGPDLGKRSPRR